MRPKPHRGSHPQPENSIGATAPFTARSRARASASSSGVTAASCVQHQRHHHHQTAAMKPRHEATRQQPAPLAAGMNDDVLPAAPPAFPQPVSSLPHDPAFLPAPGSVAAAAAAAAGQYAAAGASSTLPVSSRAYSASLPPPQQHQQHIGIATNGAAAAQQQPYFGGQFAQPDGRPYEAAMAPYASAVPVSRWRGELDVPLLGDAGGGYAGDLSFANRQARHAFLRRVLALLTLQLLLTAALAAPLSSHKRVRRFVAHNTWLTGLAGLLHATLLLVLAWSEAARRARPTNMLLLAALTATQAALAGCAAAALGSHVPLLCLLLAAVATLSLVPYASQLASDFSASGGTLVAAAAVLASLLGANAALGFNPVALLEGGCGALLFGAWAACDLAALAAGEGPSDVATDEVVFGVLTVYTDVIALGMHVLQVATQVHDGGGPYD